MKTTAFFFLCLAWLVQPAQAQGDAPDGVISLAGTWRVRLDAADTGLGERWFDATLAAAERIELPGTTDLAGLGHALDVRAMRYDAPFPYTLFPGVAATERADARGFLVRAHMFLGPAWYERELEIPESWRDRVVTLFLERALWRTDAWIDGRPLGAADSLVAPHEHGPVCLAPGRHRLTVRVDNRMLLNISTIAHGYGPETQSRWNGLVGRIELVGVPALSVRRLDVYPAADRTSVRVVAVLTNAGSNAAAGDLHLRVLAEGNGRELASVRGAVHAPAGESREELLLRLEAPATPWDEFSPVRYRLEAELASAGGGVARTVTPFGFRHVERQGRAILVNGRRVFLRGTLDCAVYPRTGHPPMTVGEWEAVMRTIRDHGFNHVRFHTWCPPEAAFEAADRLGIYLMPETVTWVDDWTRGTYGSPPAIGRDETISAFVRAELRRLSEAYGNHPSFALCCVGNEFGMEGTDWDAVAAWVREAKERDARRLYLGTTTRRSLAPDDFWVSAYPNGVSGRGVGPAHTEWDFAAAARATELPVIAHETGQRPVFPDYDELLPKFTGPLVPANYARLRERVIANGLAAQVKDFERASARFQLVQYKAEHEAMRRTADFAGYQLLMLNDFTGQSEALVGILDPFWESKGVVSVEDVRAWNAPTVPLARFARYTWSTADEFRAVLEVRHDGAADLERVAVRWELVTDEGAVLGESRAEAARVPTGGITPLGEARAALGGLARAAAMTLRVRVGEAENSWRLWAYPPAAEAAEGDCITATRFDETVERALAGGRRVLLLAHGVHGMRAAKTGFESVYWSAGWWGNAFSSLGIVCDPAHPALAEFPNDGHSDWQWRDLTQGATTFRLEGAPPGFRPIVQPVPDFHYAELLGHVFEARVGAGRVLVCGYDLTSELEKRHAARQLRRSLLRYVSSDAFAPRHALDAEFLREMIGSS